MSETWAKWQGQVICGQFRLRRYLGSSEHSGVFLSDLTARQPSDVAIKLVPAIPPRAESQLAAWRAAAGLDHPHLIVLFETGRCELDDRPYLYAVMEYADQTLAQVLSHRPLTEVEAREMLLPTLSALAFLHSRNLVQGQVKPANILAVGDLLKLASDTIRRAGEVEAIPNTASRYDPPEAADGGYSCAGDIWSLGAGLFEVLTGSLPQGLQDSGARIQLPSDFSPTFREIVASCLSPRPEDRPKVTDIEAWAHGRSPSAAPVEAPPLTAVEAPPPATIEAQQLGAFEILQSTTVEARQPSAAVEARRSPAAVPTAVSRDAGSKVVSADAAAPTVVSKDRAGSEGVSTAEGGPQSVNWYDAPPEVVGRDAAALRSSRQRFLAPLVLGAVALLGLSWAWVHMFRSPRALQTHLEAPLKSPGEAAPVTGDRPPQSLATAVVETKPAQVEATIPPSAVHEELPIVPGRARRTIRGHIKVSVRVIVDTEGTVVAALVDERGPSRYFERLSIEAAKKWTFPADDAQAKRLKLVQFEFTRGGTKGRAVSLQSPTGDPSSRHARREGAHTTAAR